MEHDLVIEWPRDKREMSGGKGFAKRPHERDGAKHVAELIVLADNENIADVRKRRCRVGSHRRYDVVLSGGGDFGVISSKSASSIFENAEDDVFDWFGAGGLFLAFFFGLNSASISLHAITITNIHRKNLIMGRSASGATRKDCNIRQGLCSA